MFICMRRPKALLSLNIQQVTLCECHFWFPYHHRLISVNIVRCYWVYRIRINIHFTRHAHKMFFKCIWFEHKLAGYTLLYKRVRRLLFIAFAVGILPFCFLCARRCTVAGITVSLPIARCNTIIDLV